MVSHGTSSSLQMQVLVRALLNLVLTLWGRRFRRLFSIKSSFFFSQRNRRISRLVFRGKATSKGEQPQRRRQKQQVQQPKLWAYRTHFCRFLCHHRKTNFVELDRNYNAIVTLIFKVQSNLALRHPLNPLSPNIHIWILQTDLHTFL